MAHLDWLQYTVKEFYTDEMVMSCKESAFYSLPQPLQDDILSYIDGSGQLEVISIRGVNFYQSGFEFSNGIKVFYNPIKEEMGYNVIVSGDVLTNIDYTDDDISNWYNYNSEYITLSRIDVAYDTDIDFSCFYNKYQVGEYLTRLTDIRSYVNTENRGTLYFGKRSGRVMFRIYDKKLEQIDNCKGRKNKDRLRKELSTWTRIEGQFRHDAAEKALLNYLLGNIGNIFLGHLRFVESLDVINKSRDSKIWDVYKDILGGNLCMKITKKKNECFNAEYFEKNVMSQVKAVMMVNPALYDALLNVSSPSKSTLEKLHNDELYLKREQKRLVDKGQINVQQLIIGGLE